MSNPFDGPQQTRAGDRLYFEGKEIGGSGPAGGDDIVRFDPVAMTASPAGKAMLDAMMTQLRKEQMQHTEATVKAVAKAVKPYEKRIAQLEEQLAAAQADVVDAIGKALGNFIDGDDTDTATQIVKAAMRETPELYE